MDAQAKETVGDMFVLCALSAFYAFAGAILCLGHGIITIWILGITIGAGIDLIIGLMLIYVIYLYRNVLQLGWYWYKNYR